ncbi:MAG TPA: hypothetical protein PKX15_00735 [Bacteroidales bacterium]|nr:hypothetical protein [Bacteroidales bacterium]
MTLNQLYSLTDEELGMALYIVNHLEDSSNKIQYNPHNLTWFKHDALIKKFLRAFEQIKPEGHTIYVSLMKKLGVHIEINSSPTNESQRIESPENNRLASETSVPLDDAYG